MLLDIARGMASIGASGFAAPHIRMSCAPSTSCRCFPFARTGGWLRLRSSSGTSARRAVLRTRAAPVDDVQSEGQRAEAGEAAPPDSAALPEEVVELTPAEAAELQQYDAEVAQAEEEYLSLRRVGLGALNFVIVFVVAFLLPSALPLHTQKEIGLGVFTAYSFTVASVLCYLTWPSADTVKSPPLDKDDFRW